MTADYQSHVTKNHDEIRKWIEERGGIPSSVRGTAGKGEEAGILRVDFPGYGAGEEALKHIDWEEFFQKFDESRLSFLYQNRTKRGGKSRFFKFVRQERPA